MHPSSVLVASIFFVLTAFYVISSNKQEEFESIYTGGPEWFHKQPYDINDWFVE